MVIYEAQISEFLEDVANEVIVDRLYNVYQEKIGRTSKSEIRSWDHSLQRMSNVLRDWDIPKDAKAAIEFKIPNTGKSVDFIIAGNDGHTDRAVIVELKQWEAVEKNERLDAVVVETYLGGAERQTTHPSYQAWSYAALIEDFNEEVRNRPIHLQPCAYLHNDHYILYFTPQAHYLKKVATRIFIEYNACETLIWWAFEVLTSMSRRLHTYDFGGTQLRLKHLRNLQP